MPLRRPLSLLPAIAAVVVLTWPGVGVVRAQREYRLDAQSGWQPTQDVDPASPEGKLLEIRRKIADGAFSEAGDLADDWLETYPDHPLAAEAELLHGDSRMARRNYYKSLFNYEAIIRKWPASEYYHIALQREMEIANLFASGTRRKLWGMRIVDASDEAEELYIRIQERAPGSQLGHDASLALAEFYYKRGDMISAAEAYDLFVENYPGSPKRQQAMLRVIQANLGTFRGPRYDATGLIEAKQRIVDYRRAYPAAAQAIDTDGLLVRIENSLGAKMLYNADWYVRRDELVSAAYVYARTISDFPTTQAARIAAEKLAALEAQGVRLFPLPERAPADEPMPPLRVPVPDDGEAPAEGADGAEAPGGTAGAERVLDEPAPRDAAEPLEPANEPPADAAPSPLRPQP